MSLASADFGTFTSVGSQSTCGSTRLQESVSSFRKGKKRSVLSQEVPASEHDMVSSSERWEGATDFPSGCVIFEVDGRKLRVSSGPHALAEVKMHSVSFRT